MVGAQLAFQHVAMLQDNRSSKSWPEAGQLLPTLALIVTALLAVCTLGIDVFTMYWAKLNLQRSTDAAALAGAMYLNNATFPGANPTCASYTTPAQKAA